MSAVRSVRCEVLWPLQVVGMGTSIVEACRVEQCVVTVVEAGSTAAPHTTGEHSVPTESP